MPICQWRRKPYQVYPGHLSLSFQRGEARTGTPPMDVGSLKGSGTEIS